jgi:spectinomycin phosphotransferase
MNRSRSPFPPLYCSSEYSCGGNVFAEGALGSGNLIPMLEEPPIHHVDIATVLRDAYGLSAAEIAFLPLGADINTAAYRIATKEGNTFFLKLRDKTFHKASIAVPMYLRDHGMKEIIPAVATRSGALAEDFGRYKAILYPFVKGHNAIETPLTEEQWFKFGAALKRFHTVEFPRAVTQGIPTESFSSRWRDEARLFLRRAGEKAFGEPVAAELAAFLISNTSETLDLVNRAESLARLLAHQRLHYVLCHGDIHGWNLLIDEEGKLYIVDWDTLIFAPKERDLMFIGAGLGETGYPPDEEQRLFFEGYGPTHVNQAAIAYYRFERIVEDIAVYCEQVFDSSDGLEDRRQAVENVKSNFLPGNTIQMAYEAASVLKPG